jgi:hypothetical protein
MRMREGKDGGGKGPLLSEGLALTLSTGATDVLFVPPQPMAFDRYNGVVTGDVTHTLAQAMGTSGLNAPIVATPPSPAGSPGSEDWTWASNEPGSASSPIPRSSPTPAPSSPATGPTSPTSGTYPRFVFHYHTDTGNPSVQTDGTTNSLTAQASPQAVAFGPAPMSGQGVPLAKGSASQDSDEDSMTTAAASPSPGLTLWDDTDPALSSSRTYQASSRRLMAWTGTPSYAHWESSGTGGPTGFSTLSGSECPSDGDGCSSSPSTLADILTPTAPDRFSLSARAAAGIMRRSAKRGRRLPAELDAALASLAEVQTALSPNVSGGPEMQARHSTPDVPSPPSWTVRRITPVEGERLMGWPDGHTIAPSSKASGRSRSMTTSPGEPTT